MTSENKELLEQEINDIFANLNGVDATSEEYKNGIDAAVTLIKQSTEIDKLEFEINKLEYEKLSKAEKDKREEEENKRNKIDKIIGYLIQITGIMLPLAVTMKLANDTFKFEENGTITTSVGKNVIQKMFKLK